MEQWHSILWIQRRNHGITVGLRKLVSMTSKRNILLFSLMNCIVALNTGDKQQHADICSLLSAWPIAWTNLSTGILMVAGSVQTASLAFANSIFLTGWDVETPPGPVVASPIITIWNWSYRSRHHCP
jgi:hypothetical protein